MSDDIETKTYEIEFATGEVKRIVVPATWKVSFGAIVPAAKGGSSSTSWGLRIWESTDKQRAVFANVIAFRDVSIPLMVRAARKFGTEDWEIDRGQFKDEDVERQWMAPERVNPETVEEEVDWGPATLYLGRKTVRSR